MKLDKISRLTLCVALLLLIASTNSVATTHADRHPPLHSTIEDYQQREIEYIAKYKRSRQYVLIYATDIKQKYDSGLGSIFDLYKANAIKYQQISDVDLSKNDLLDDLVLEAEKAFGITSTQPLEVKVTDKVQLDSIRKLADAGNIRAMNDLGALYASEFHEVTNFQADFETSLKWYRKSASKNDPLALYVLGWALLTGNLGASTDILTGIETLDSAASLDYPKATLQLAKFYSQNDQYRDYEKSHAYYLKTIELTNDPQSLYSLGVMYGNGLGVETNYQIAHDYFKRGTEMEHPESAIALAHSHMNGLAGKPDLLASEQALRVFMARSWNMKNPLYLRYKSLKSELEKKMAEPLQQNKPKSYTNKPTRDRQNKYEYIIFMIVLCVFTIFFVAKKIVVMSLTEEKAIQTIQQLIGSGKINKAKTKAKQFLKIHPDSLQINSLLKRINQRMS